MMAIDSSKLGRVLAYVADGAMIVMGIAGAVLGTSAAVNEYQFNKRVDNLIKEDTNGSSETNEGE